MDNLREEFEQWWNNKMAMCFYSLPKSQKETIFHASWIAWQASRASIVVEPTHFVLKNEITGPWGCDEDLRCYTLRLDANKAKDDFGGEIIPVIDLRSIGLSIKGE